MSEIQYPPKRIHELKAPPGMFIAVISIDSEEYSLGDACSTLAEAEDRISTSALSAPFQIYDDRGRKRAYPLTIEDLLGTDSTKKTTWSYCGEFPIDLVRAGRRACRRHWRERGKGVPFDANGDNGYAMWHVVAVEDDNEHDRGPCLVIQFEFATELEGSMPFNALGDLEQVDWYVAPAEDAA